MVSVYIVRCNFTVPDREAEWNAWYSGPKIVQMLTQPYFLSCQRFHRVSGRGRNYLALWTVERPEALTTPQYRSQWGFVEWEALIAGWSRDLFDGGDARPADFAAEPGGALQVLSFDGMAKAAEDAVAAQPDMRWLPSVGLDRHTPMIGLRPLAPGAAPSPAAPADAFAENAIYQPITEFHTARRAAPAA
jgi:hypothetical protein